MATNGISRRLLITDLDNTLYDWVTFFALSFQAMTDRLVAILEVDRETVIRDFKRVHQRYGSSEQPFAALELECVQAQYPSLTREGLLKVLSPAFEAFNEARKRHLSLYEGVTGTLATLRERGVRMVAHTEALAVNSWFRLRYLGIEDYFSHIYALEGELRPHPDPMWNGGPALREKIRIVPREERKPNPALLEDICRREGYRVEDACYVGDSLVRDISMAKGAGVMAVWARYGTTFQPEHWDILLAITHWTEEDVVREAQLRRDVGEVVPDRTIDTFADVMTALDSLTEPRGEDLRGPE